MRAGSLRYVVVLQVRDPDSTSDSGAPDDTYTDEGTLRAAIRPLGAQERIEASRQYGEVTHLVTVRGRHVTPTPAKRWKWVDRKSATTRYLEIVGVMDWDEKGHEVRSMCREAQ